MLVIESRPEYINKELITQISTLTKNLYTEIAIGLELKNDYLRYICVNKGFSLKDYNKAAELITKKLNLRTYVLLKPLFLSEKKSINEAVKTIKHAFKYGSKTVSLEAVTVQDYTLVEYFYRNGLYNPPWLWSIIKVIKETYNLGKLITGLFQFYPLPKRVPNNCSKCNKEILQAITKYNQTLNIREVSNLYCDCLKDWKRELKKKNISIDKQLQLLKSKSKEIFEI